LDDDAALLADHFLDLTRLAAVVARDDDHVVATLDLHHTTSCASEMIFMKLRSRSSRATAPKMRVPLGLLSASTNTSAFWSKRTYDPSGRRVFFLTRTITPLATEPGLSSEPGSAFLTETTITSPRPAVR